MSLRDEITHLRESILQRVELAARTGSARDVVDSSKLLEATEELLGSYNSLESRLQEIKSKVNGTQAIETIPPIPPSPTRLGAKAKGKQRRQAFLADAESRGIVMTKVKGVCYQSPNHGRLVGIASASESDKHPNRWLLGLPSANYDGFVLLCEDKTGQVHRFIAGIDFSQEVLPKLSRDDTGQIKFHVTRDGGCFYLHVLGGERQSLNALLEKFEDL
ncbi:MAG: hypothetical protein OXI72_17950 [Gemmatimonadota bacterium]|nr:hypothetical protein [Gemmatimonadota bacterium]